MNIKQIPAQIEISFWSTVTPMMSDTPFLRRLIRGVYDFTQVNYNFCFIKGVMVWSGAGLVLGFLVGLLMGSFSG